MEFQVAKGNWRRSFGSLWLAQLQAAFTANAYEFLVIFMLAKEGLSGAETSLRWAVQGIFAAPFILFSMAAGRLADRSSKRTVAVATQIGGVGVLALAASALALGNLPLVLLALFLTGAQGAFFSPAKYGLLPELVPHERLSWANGIIALATFTATILGVLAGGWMSESLTRAWSGGLLVVLALFGVVASLGIARVRAAEPGVKIRLNFVADAVEQFGRARKDRVLFLALAGSTSPSPPKAGPVQIMKSSELKPGMMATAWTVFNGSEPEAVPVEIIGLWKNAWGPKQDAKAPRALRGNWRAADGSRRLYRSVGGAQQRA